NVGIATPDHRLAALENVRSGDTALVIEQGDTRLSLAPRRHHPLSRRGSGGLELRPRAAKNLHRHALTDAIAATRAEQIDALEKVRAAMRARARAGGRNACAAVPAKGQSGVRGLRATLTPAGQCICTRRRRAPRSHRWWDCR